MSVSEIINKVIPINKPLLTAKVWLPKYVDSVVISLNQENIMLTKQTKHIEIGKTALAKACIPNTPIYTKLNKDKLDNAGQGEGKTKWKGWAWNVLLLATTTNSLN